MTEPIILLSGIAAGGVRTVFYLLLVRRLLTDSKRSVEKPPVGKRMKTAAAAALAGSVVCSSLSFLSGWPDFYRMALETIWLAVCAGRFWGADARMSLFIGIFYEIAISFWQFLAGAWSGALFHSPAFLDIGTGEGQTVIWLLHALVAAAALYLWKHPDIDGKEAFRFASAIAVAGFVAVVTLSQQNAPGILEDELDMWTILAVVLMMSVLVFNMNRQYEMEKELARLKSEQAGLLERDYAALSRAYAVNARLFHDFHNHIGVLRLLLSYKKLEEAVEYLDDLQAPVKEMTDTVWTGDETVDYLINSKAQAAGAAGIQYRAQVEFPRHTNLGSADLCAILGNLLDNALEAAGQVPEEEERFVRLTICRINQMLIIKTENSFKTPPVIKNGELKTSKGGNGLHGWGLKSARAAAEKYDGTVQTSCAGNVFRAVVTLSYQGAVTK